MLVVFSVLFNLWMSDVVKFSEIGFSFVNGLL